MNCQYLFPTLNIFYVQNVQYIHKTNHISICISCLVLIVRIVIRLGLDGLVCLISEILLS